MKRKTLLTAVSALLGSAGVALVGLMAVTAGDAPMVDTVTSDPDLPRIVLDGVTLHGELIGDQGPLAIVLHGGPGGDYRSLQALGALAETHRVLFFDQRGAGLSERLGAGDLTIAASLADIDALAERYSPDRAVTLIGHSFGAMLALAYIGSRPDRVDRAVLIEPGFLDQVGYATWEARRAEISRALSVAFTGLVAGFEARNVTTDDPDAQRDYIVGAVVHAFANEASNPYHCEGEAYDAPAWRFGATVSDTFWADPAPLFNAIAPALNASIPMLFVAGGCNRWTGEDLQASHAARFQSADLVTFPNAGHDVIWDQPDAALAAINTFVRQ